MLLHTFEGIVEKEYMRLSELQAEDMQTIFNDLGTLAGWHPLIQSYDKIPYIKSIVPCLPEIPNEVIDYLNNHKRINPSEEEISRIKSRPRALYEAGLGAKVEERVSLPVQEEEEEQANENDKEDRLEACLMGKRIQIPTETFVEELSVKMEIHPILIYWLLKERREKDVQAGKPALLCCLKQNAM